MNGQLGLFHPYEWSYGPLLITSFLGPPWIEHVSCVSQPGDEKIRDLIRTISKPWNHLGGPQTLEVALRVPKPWRSPSENCPNDKIRHVISNLKTPNCFPISRNPGSPKTIKNIGFSPKTIFKVGNLNHPKLGISMYFNSLWFPGEVLHHL